MWHSMMMSHVASASRDPVRAVGELRANCGVDEPWWRAVFIKRLAYRLHSPLLGLIPRFPWHVIRLHLASFVPRLAIILVPTAVCTLRLRGPVRVRGRSVVHNQCRRGERCKTVQDGTRHSEHARDDLQDGKRYETGALAVGCWLLAVKTGW